MRLLKRGARIHLIILTLKPRIARASLLNHLGLSRFKHIQHLLVIVDALLYLVHSAAAIWHAFVRASYATFGGMDSNVFSI